MGGCSVRHWVDGEIALSALDKPGFGVALNPAIPLHRPYVH